MSNDKANVFIYQTQENALIQLILGLVKKTYSFNKNGLIVCKSNEQVDFLDNILWTRLLWLPHGKAGCANDNLQPFIISTNLNVKNKPKYLFLINNIVDLDDYLFERIVLIFTNEESKNLAKGFINELSLREGTVFEYYDYKNGKYEKNNNI